MYSAEAELKQMREQQSVAGPPSLLSQCLSLPRPLQKVVLSSGVEPNLALPLDMGLPLQLKLDVFKVVLSQGPTMEVLAVSLSGLDSLRRLWSHPQGHLSLGALPGKRMLFKYISSRASKHILRERDLSERRKG